MSWARCWESLRTRLVCHDLPRFSLNWWSTDHIACHVFLKYFLLWCYVLKSDGSLVFLWIFMGFPYAWIHPLTGASQMIRACILEILCLFNLVLLVSLSAMLYDACLFGSCFEYQVSASVGSVLSFSSSSFFLLRICFNSAYRFWSLNIFTLLCRQRR